MLTNTSGVREIPQHVTYVAKKIHWCIVIISARWQNHYLRPNHASPVTASQISFPFASLDHNINQWIKMLECRPELPTPQRISSSYNEPVWIWTDGSAVNSGIARDASLALLADRFLSHKEKRSKLLKEDAQMLTFVCYTPTRFLVSRTFTVLKY